MADRGAESGQQPIKRRGWQLPPAPGSPPGSVPPGPGRFDRADARHGPRPPQGARPRSVLANSVAGQARNVALGTMEDVSRLTFRLEQHDPYAGRTGLVTVRMRGDQAIGFVTEGDWVEVQGRSKRGFLDAKRAFNHTSGAQFRGPSAGWGAAGITAVVIFVLLILSVMAVIITKIVSAISTFPTGP